MKKMIELVGKLEAAFKAGKNDEAAKVIAELDAQQKSSHKEFRKPKPKQ
jgi:cytochrome c556